MGELLLTSTQPLLGFFEVVKELQLQAGFAPHARLRQGERNNISVGIGLHNVRHVPQA